MTCTTCEADCVRRMRAVLNGVRYYGWWCFRCGWNAWDAKAPPAESKGGV